MVTLNQTCERSLFSDLMAQVVKGLLYSCRHNGEPESCTVHSENHLMKIFFSREDSGPCRWFLLSSEWSTVAAKSIEPKQKIKFFKKPKVLQRILAVITAHVNVNM